MVLFERLRQRLRRRRLERKLQDLSRSGARTREPRDLLDSRVKIKPLAAGSSRVLTVESASSPASSRARAATERGSTQATSCWAAEPVQPIDSQSQHHIQPLNAALVRYVTSYNAQSLVDFVRERKLMQELQTAVPTIRPLIVKWAEWHRRSQEVVLRSTRDVKRWRAFHEKAHAELQSIHDIVMKALATSHKNSKFSAQRIPTTAALQLKLTREGQIIVMMVSLALVAGVYGLLLLAAFLKYKKKI